MQLLPSHDAVSLITVLPEQLQSPLLTAEWEYRLGEIERGQLAPEEFLDGISTMPVSYTHLDVYKRQVHLVAGKLHKEIRETEQDNVGVESAHKSEEAVETSACLLYTSKHQKMNLNKIMKMNLIFLKQMEKNL